MNGRRKPPVNQWRPIAEAGVPLRGGQRFGPVLLAPGPRGELYVPSYHDGDGWWTADASADVMKVEPEWFFIVPPPPGKN